MVRVELELTLKGRHMLSVNLVGESPEDTLPDQASLGILQTQVVLIVDRLRIYCEVEVGHVEPETDCDACSDG